MKLLMAKAGEGAGDMVLTLNIAHTHARYFNTDVELEYHWRQKEDYKVMPQDPETVVERMDDMNSRMANPDRVEVIHLFDSDIFYTQGNPSMWEGTKEALRERALFEPKRWFPNVHSYMPEGLNHARYLWSEKPTTTKTIVTWDSSENVNVLRNTKKTRNDWGYMRDYIQDRFPEHKIISLSYRDSFDTAYNAIRDCEFCFGYDGMWHLVAENFGKLLVVISEYESRWSATPDASMHTSKKILPYIDLLSDTQFLRSEQTRMKEIHNRHMEWFR
tara:strand:+ start:947 stop:1768 length:822 start_codon:yes stop_codon:yes gene_type:complete